MLRLEDLAGWLVSTSCVFTLVPLLRRPPPRPRGWLLLLGGLLCLSVIHMLLGWAWLAWTTVSLWLSLVVLPSVATGRLREASLRRDLPGSYRWARLLAFVHPTDGMPAQAQFVALLLALERGDQSRAEALLQPLKAPGNRGWYQRAHAQWLRETAGWEGVMAAFGDGTLDRAEPLLGTIYTQALGETGQLNAMWEAYQQMLPELRSRADVRLSVAALGGQLSLVEQLARHSYAVGSAVSRFWQATALQTSGLSAAAQAPLRELSAGDDAPARWARERLLHPLPDQRHYGFTPTAVDIMAKLGRQIGEELALSTPLERRGMAWGTIGLGAVLLGMFANSIPGGPSNVANLVELGALVLPPHLVTGSVVYRAVSAGLLHFGATHLFVNLLGLWVLGHQVERLWSGTVLWLLFFSSSIGSMAIAVATMAATESDPKVIVGASAGVMGLVGALFTFSAVGYFVANNQLLRRSLTRIVAIVLLQTAFDSMTPAVSTQLHLTGLVIGAVAALPFALHRWLRQMRATPAAEPHPPPDGV